MRSRQLNRALGRAVKCAAAAVSAMFVLAAVHVCSSAPTVPPDVSLATMPVAYYGAQWDRDDANIAALARMSVVSLMQEEGPCWTTCCPNASKGLTGGRCNPLYNATSLPGCDPSCDQHGYQNKVFERIKAAAAAAGRRPPHCLVFANTIYDWPFMITHAQGNAVDVVATNGQPHMESCDPGIFPSFFFDYGRTAGQQAYLDIVERIVVNGSADGVYADCYGQFGLKCARNGTGCTAKRNGRVQSYNNNVTPEQVVAYEIGKNRTMRAAAEIVGPNGSLYAKLSPADCPPKFGAGAGNLLFVEIDDADVNASVTQIRMSLRFYKYLVVGGGNSYKHPTAGGGHGAEASVCTESQVAMFLLVVEPGCFLLCQGWDSAWGDGTLGLPLGPAKQDASGAWSRKFALGTTASFSGGKGTVTWARQ